jgi:hypothetical protein
MVCVEGVSERKLFRSEIHQLFAPFPVDGVLAEASAEHKGKLSADDTLLKKELTLLHLPEDKELRCALELLLGEVYPFFDMCTE